MFPPDIRCPDKEIIWVPQIPATSPLPTFSQVHISSPRQMEVGECEEVKKPKAGGLVVDVKKEEGFMVGSATSSRPTLLKASGAKATMPSPNHLTVFYGGRVFVFDTIPEEKVREILLIATTATAAKSGDVKAEAIGQPGTPVLTRSPSLQSTASVLASPQAQLYPVNNNPSHCNIRAGFPITSKHSLQRFFEKRRDRLVSKSPYATPTAEKLSETTTPEAKLEAWLDAGCLEETMARGGEVKAEVSGGVA